MVYVLAGLYLKCGQVGCSHSFGSFSGFRKHLNKCHVSSSFDSAKNDFSPRQSVLDTNNADVDVLPESFEAESELYPADIVNSCAAVISDLKAAGVSQSVVNSVVNSMEEIVQDIQQHAKETVNKHVNTSCLLTFLNTSVSLSLLNSNERETEVY